MKLALIKSALAAVAFAAVVPTAAQAAWTRTYALEWAEPAMYYGAKTGVVDPGTDCPAGNKEVDWVKVLTEAGYTKDEANWLRNPANPTRSPVNGQNQMAFRGKDRANVYIHPETAPESGELVPVSGTIGYGLDLDGNANNGFTSPDGVKGIDNNFYKAVGCWKTYRGPHRLASGPLGQNDTMREGGYSVVIVVTGAGKDPMNDNNVQVGFYDSTDKLVKDGNGNISADYTFRIKPSENEAIFKAKTVKGRIISTQATDKAMMREPSYTRELELLKARIDLTMQADGTLKGIVAGYRPWQPVYDGWVRARGPVIESLTWVRLPDVYYALKHWADYSPTGPDGPKTHISFALAVDAVPAFVMKPDAHSQVAAVESYKALVAQVRVASNGPVTAAAAAAAPPSAIGFIVDGLALPRGGKAVSQTPEQMKPPAQ